MEEHTDSHPRHVLRATRRRRRLPYRRVVERLSDRGIETSISYVSDVERGTRELGSLAIALAFEEMFGIPAEAWPKFSALPKFLELRKRA